MTEYILAFPGQGSQKIGVLEPLIGRYQEVDLTLEEASSFLKQDILKLLKDPIIINDIVWAQPLLFVVEVALWRAWERLMPCSPVALAGHSLGEYAALVASSVLSFTDALSIILKRVFWMNHSQQDLCGMIVVVGLSYEQVQALCEEVVKVHGFLSVANLNSEEQFVLSGYLSACEWVKIEAKRLGAKIVKLLPIKVASHCFLMEKAAIAFEKELCNFDFKEAKISVFSNVDGKQHSKGDEFRSLLVKQLISPVNWLKIVKSFKSSLFLECGPGKVLCGLVKRINSSILGYSLGENLEQVESLCHGK